jgi:hypothetical protein
MNITVTVRKKHLDAAMAATAKSGWSINEVCLVAQAVKDVFPRKAVCVSYTDITVGRNNGRVFSLPKAAIHLIHRFDKAGAGGELTKGEKAHLAKLRQSLPIAFTVVEN